MANCPGHEVMLVEKRERRGRVLEGAAAVREVSKEKKVLGRGLEGQRGLGTCGVRTGRFP